MPCSEFTLTKVRENFSLTLQEGKNLFADVVGVQSSGLLTSILDAYLPLAIAINSEKVRSEFINQQCGNDIEVIYGAVTTGTTWRCLALKEQIVSIDEIEYYIKEMDKIIGIVMQPIRAARKETIP